jgi:peptidoglycan/LPS O-acetylase OafA/YrhL
MVAGDLGVDIFFVLSGFLISYILLKEFKKYGGRIDVLNFYRGRFLRLIPVMLPWAIANWIYTLYWAPLPENVEPSRGASAWGYLYTLTFTNNFVGTGDQAWSLAVEFQFYILSPLIVYYMARAQNGKAIYAPIALAIISLYLRVMLLWKLCPDMLQNGTGVTDATC